MTLSIDYIQQQLLRHTPKLVSQPIGTRAAVLIPIIKREESLFLLFTKRTELVEHHKGQISFPGGACDTEDESNTATALRESEEEIGLPKHAVKIVGTLNDIVIPTGFVVTPIVGFIEQLPPLKENGDEVAELIFIPLEEFFKQKNFRREMRILKEVNREIFIYDVWKEPIWGATALMIKDFVDVLNINALEVNN
ncbi:MAG: CoA pyrophosphatase [Bacteroidetes bacterium]|nr:CoA pyrophosphatase [Bacteroidota bacterium]